MLAAHRALSWRRTFASYVTPRRSALQQAQSGHARRQQ
jgi:hypothetical protein